jgi:hypothetical protein
MKTYKILFGRESEILSVTESENQIPENKTHYFDKAKDKKYPDFLLVKAEDTEGARKIGEAFLAKWKNTDAYDEYSNG